MGGIARRGDRHHRARLRHVGGGGEHGGTAEAVADQDRGRAARAPQRVRGGDEVAHVRGERRVGEFALAGAEPGEVEAQHGDAERGQGLGDAPRRVDVLAAGEAVREQRIGARLTHGSIEQRGEVLPRRIGKIEPLRRHEFNLR